MLTFLRKIRRSLIESGSARKYLFYAIGEIALVVLGILIALQINNWNNTKQEKAQEQMYLKQLRQDLIYDTLSLNVVLRNIDGHNKSASRVLYFIETGKITDTLRLYKDLVFSGYMYFFNANMSTYNDLISSGNIRLIRDTGLKRRLDRYVSHLQQIEKRYELNKRIVWFGYQDYSKKFLDGRIGHVLEIDSITLRHYPVEWKEIANDIVLKNQLTEVIGAAQSENRWQLSNKRLVIRLIEYLDGLIVE